MDWNLKSSRSGGLSLTFLSTETRVSLTEELGIVLRSMGQNPSNKELVDMIGEMDEDGSGTVDFEEFVILMKRRTADSDGNDDIEAAFKVFDTKNDGLVSAQCREICEYNLILAVFQCH